MSLADEASGEVAGVECSTKTGMRESGMRDCCGGAAAGGSATASGPWSDPSLVRDRESGEEGGAVALGCAQGGDDGLLS